ncbi:DUF7601 domain-containing protein [Eisenbergiella sp.]
MKKILSILFAIVLTLSMGTVALAEEGNYTDMSQVTITKEYKLTNPGTISPAETFTFSNLVNYSVTDAAEGVTVENMPTPTISSISYGLGEAGSENMKKTAVITLPDNYESVGVYTYVFSETQGDTAGVTYYDKEIKLVVTVLQGENGRLRIAAVHAEAEDGDKTDNFPNEYSAGSLAITKVVTGNMGDQSKYFNVTVTLNGEEKKNYADSYAVTGGSLSSNPGSIEIGVPTEFQLKHGDTITIENLPYGVTYTVAEADYTKDEDGNDDYDQATYTLSDKNCKIDSASDTVTITNNKDTDIDTGVLLDNVPYVLLLACVFGGMSVFFAKKRSSREE